MKVIRFLIGVLLLAAGLGWLLLAASSAASAESVTVNGTVNEISQLSLDAMTVTFENSDPGKPVELPNAVTVRVDRNIPTPWSLQTRATSTSMPNDRGFASLNTSCLKWQGGTVFSYTSFTDAFAPVYGGNGATGVNGDSVAISFRLDYPANAAPGKYTATIEFMLS